MGKRHTRYEVAGWSTRSTVKARRLQAELGGVIVVARFDGTRRVSEEEMVWN